MASSLSFYGRKDFYRYRDQRRHWVQTPAPTSVYLKRRHNRIEPIQKTIISVMSTWDRVKNLLGFGPKCENGGDKVNGVCNCTNNWEGEFCDRIVCRNGGTAVKNYKACLCPDNVNYRGLHCERMLCQNGGVDNQKGKCDCLDNWYSGDFCQHYSSPWGFVFGGLAAFLILLVIACILCRLQVCKRRSRRRHDSPPLDELEAPPTRRQQRRQRRRDAPRDSRRPPSASLRNGVVVQNGEGVEYRISRPPPYPEELAKLEEAPPSYEEVVTNLARFPSVAPSLDGAQPTSSSAVLRQLSAASSPQVILDGSPGRPVSVAGNPVSAGSRSVSVASNTSVAVVSVPGRIQRTSTVHSSNGGVEL